ncbi:MAG: hypothetical protein K6G01_05450 [Eubacterium sp.]|nr:hypothetical protein [Eubacterium sp.]
MTQVIRQYAGAIVAVVVAVLIIAALSYGNVLQRMGTAMQMELGSSVSTGQDIDTTYGLQKQQTITLALVKAPTKNQWYQVQDLVRATQGNKQVTCRLVGVKKCDSAEDAVKAKEVEVQKSTSKLSFKKSGDYKILVRAYGSVRMNKTFMVHVTEGTV